MIYEIPDREYRNLPALSQSKCKRILKSGREFKSEVQYSSDALTFGALVDCIVFTPWLEQESFVITPDWANHPDNCKADGTPSTSSRTGWVREKMSEFGKKHAGKTFITKQQQRDARAVAREILSKNKVKEWLQEGGKTQVTYTGEIHGVECKGLFDFITPTALIDLKTTRSQHRSSFRSDFFRYRYGFQLAWYLELARQNGATLTENDCWIIAAGKQEPFDCVVYHIPSDWIENEYENIELALTRYKEYSKNNFWPGADGGEDFLSLAEPELEIEWDLEGV